MSKLKICKAPPKEVKYPFYDFSVHMDFDSFCNECKSYSLTSPKSPNLIVDILPRLYKTYVASINALLLNYNSTYGAREVKRGIYDPFNGISPYRMSFKRFKENAWISKDDLYYDDPPDYHLMVRYECDFKDEIDAAHEAAWKYYNAWLKDNAEELEEIRLSKNATAKVKRDVAKENKIAKLKADLAKLEEK